MSSLDRRFAPALPARPLRARLAPRLSALALALGVLPLAQAALFEDDEARRAIIELRQRVEANRQAADAAAQRVANQVRDQLREQFREELKRTAEENSPLRRSIIELQAQIESLRSEVASLRGQNEQLAKILSDTQQRQKDVAQTVEDRLRRFDPVTVTIDGLEFNAEPNEKRDFEAAMALFRQGNFSGARTALEEFGRRYPQSGYAASALFWLGNAHYANRDYQPAIAAFRALLARDAEHQRAPEAMLSIANCQFELKDTRGARKTLEDLGKTYPKSEAAAAARERLAKLK
ncbi:MAG: tol-pal system protein YbgF [Betaproteobacteria bacterium]|jgi:tol-pal system protein YbgF|nr:tol-pal system protein YbgF [Betaproteobacteria bacterium]NBS47213.1 tol-pal system protein YbgF [Betaproteobacteria bacterium]